jgi:ubiquitin-conjugating enzyme E2 H
MSWRKRANRDIEELIKNGYIVTAEDGSDNYTLENFMSRVQGPADSPYENYSWNVRFAISDKYPFTSPSVGFVQRILHPNIDEESGSICLDILNSAWSPTFTLKHILESYLPLLLNYPNPDDPLNREAASFMKRDVEGFKLAAKKHSEKYGIKMNKIKK